MRALAIVCIALLAPVAAATRAHHAASNLFRNAIRDSLTTRAMLERAVDTFMLASRNAWMHSEIERIGRVAGGGRRLVNIHCHRDGSFAGREGVKNSQGAPAGVIGSVFSKFSVCPDWLQPDVRERMDETSRPDAMLEAKWYQQTVNARQALLAQLDSAAAQYPNDGWITGQRVRLRMDGGQTEDALRAASTCRADVAFCTALQGYVEYGLGHVQVADALFLRAAAAMSDSARCEWTSIQLLLSRDARAQYEKLTCVQRDSVNRAAWWLGDPMYTEPGNERRAEHFARVVRTQLNFVLNRNERWDLRDARGGDAIRVVYLRYGWPSATIYGGPSVDASHDGWLAAYATPPYSAPEYSTDRVSTLPTLEAMQSPLTVQDSDFVLTTPRGSPLSLWWPSEHFRRPLGVIVTFEQGQTALFRRDDAVLFAVAARVTAPELSVRDGQRVITSLVVSPQPDSVQVVNTQVTALGRGVLLRGFIPSGAAIAGVEMQADRTSRMAARSRFGIVAPQTLLAMRPGETAVSEPVLFDAAGLDATAQSEMTNPFDYMYDGVQLTKPNRIGVFWESYGFRPGDTVSVSLRLERVTPTGKLRRIGVAIGVSSDPNGAVTASWTEPQPGRAATLIRGVLPILSRHIALDVHTLQPGTWRLRVAMHRPRESEVFADRLFEVRR